MAGMKFSGYESEDEPLIIDSKRAWDLSAIDRPYNSPRDLRIAMQGHILRCGWALHRLTRGEPGDFGTIQRFRFSAREGSCSGTPEHLAHLFAQLLSFARDVEVMENDSPQANAFAAARARQDPAVQGVISKAIKAARRGRGKGAA